MRVFLHLVNFDGTKQPDHVGREVEDDRAALDEAHSAARFLGRTYPVGALHSLHIVVEDEAGRLIGRIWCRDLL